MKILITGFKPWGMYMFNSSEHVARLLSKEYGHGRIILTVSESGMENLRRHRLEDYDMIFMLGMGDYFRIETKTNSLESDFAKRVKRKSGIETREKIGSFYCEKAYNICLSRNRNTIFIHVPMLPISKKNYEIKNIFEEAIRNVR